MISDDAAHDDAVTEVPPAAAAPLSASATEIFSPALAALTRPPQVGDTIEHGGAPAAIVGTTIRGPGDFSVLLEGGTLLSSR